MNARRCCCVAAWRSTGQKAAYSFLDARRGEHQHHRSHLGRERKLDALEANGFSCDIDTKVAPDDYLKRARASKFVFSPRGHGFANYRDWEALAMGAIPLVDAVAADYSQWANTSHAELPV